MTVKERIELWKTHPERFLDTSGRSGAKTYAAVNDGGWYLKVGARGSLRKEYETLCYFSAESITPELLGYESEEYDYLLTRPLAGKRACDADLMKDPERLAQALGEALRIFHEQRRAKCPFSNSVEDMLARAKRNHRRGIWDERLAAYVGAEDRDRLYAQLFGEKECLRDDVILHGDYCLPNIFLDDQYALTGFLDLGAAGRGDRHFDLFWGRWSLQYNLKTDRHGDAFYEAYGWDAIDGDRLRLMGYAAVLG
mgnify:FL=1